MNLNFAYFESFLQDTSVLVRALRSYLTVPEDRKKTTRLEFGQPAVSAKNLPGYIRREYIGATRGIPDNFLNSRIPYLAFDNDYMLHLDLDQDSLAHDTMV
jgi:hypothetical protein